MQRSCAMRSTSSVSTGDHGRHSDLDGWSFMSRCPVQHCNESYSSLKPTADGIRQFQATEPVECHYVVVLGDETIPAEGCHCTSIQPFHSHRPCVRPISNHQHRKPCHHGEIFQRQ